MKKTILLSLVLVCGVILSACGKKSEEVNLTDVVVEVDPACVKAVEDYLNGSNKSGEGEEIKAGDNIIVDYIGRLEDGTVFDTSIQSIAEACGEYNEYRDYTEGLSFEVGAGQMIKGFDNGVIGMKAGQTKTVQFSADEGYGQRSEEYVVTYTKDEIGDLSQYTVGDYFQPAPYVYGTITKITDKEMVVDFNHELAGKDLIFDITVKSITPSTTVSNETPSTIVG